MKKADEFIKEELLESIVGRCKLISQSLQDCFDPYTKIVITCDGVYFERTESFWPVKNGD